MKAFLGAIALLLVQPALQPPVAQAEELTVQYEQDNVVSSRLAGDWVVDQTMLERFVFDMEDIEPSMKDEAAFMLSFRSQPDALAQISDELAAEISQTQSPIYMAGTIKLRQEEDNWEGVFVLSETFGNPHILIEVTDAEGDRTDDNLNIMLVPSFEQSGDILFIGERNDYLPLRRAPVSFP